VGAIFVDLAMLIVDALVDIEHAGFPIGPSVLSRQCDGTVRGRRCFAGAGVD